MLHAAHVGDMVHIETDIVAKYLVKFLIKKEVNKK